MIGIHIDHFEYLLESILSHIEFFVHFLANLCKVNLCLSFVQISVKRGFVSVPYFLCECFEAKGLVSFMFSHFFLKELLNLVESLLYLVVVLVGTNKIVLWILVEHVVEVIIVSEQGVDWIENLS